MTSCQDGSCAGMARLCPAHETVWGSSTTETCDPLRHLVGGAEPNRRREGWEVGSLELSLHSWCLQHALVSLGGGFGEEDDVDNGQERSEAGCIAPSQGS